MPIPDPLTQTNTKAIVWQHQHLADAVKISDVSRQAGLDDNNLSVIFSSEPHRSLFNIAAQLERQRIGVTSAPPGFPNYGQLLAECLLRDLPDGYHIKDTDKLSITNYLVKRLHLYQILQDAYSVIAEVFGPAPRVLITIQSDSVEGYEILFANIETTITAIEALPRLQTFEDNWFNDQLKTCAGELSFSLEYK